MELKEATDKKIIVRKYPDPILRKKCKPIEAITGREIRLFEEMASIMYNSKCIGLAASQIGILRQLIVADIGNGLLTLTNPVVLETRGKDKMNEGCLSVPDTNVEIKRAYEVVVEGLNIEGKIVKVKTSGLMARVLQHEIDHLRGKLIVDYMAFWKKAGFMLRWNG